MPQLAVHRREMEISRQFLPPREECVARRFLADCLRELHRTDEAIKAYQVCPPASRGCVRDAMDVGPPVFTLCGGCLNPTTNTRDALLRCCVMGMWGHSAACKT